MSRNAPALPPFRTLAAALARTTEALAGELARPGAQAPAWSDFEWCIAEAVAVLQGVSALLAIGLRWQGPARWHAFLSEQARHTLLRRRRIARLLGEIGSVTRAAGIAAVALKGAALYQLGLYPAGERPMGDIDLLVREADLTAAGRALRALGYVPGHASWRHQTLEPERVDGAGGFGEHIDHPLKIELHGRIVERLPLRETDITALEFPAAAHPGLNDYPSLGALMRHLLLHAAGNLRARALRLIQLHDIALLCARMGERDWQELLDARSQGRGPWWALAPLTLTRRYYPEAVPTAVLAALGPGCPPLLRRACRSKRLTDVSWSNLRIEAFPGIEWSGSPAEALGFVASRVWPDREARAELTPHALATVHYAGAARWYDASHLERILRWLCSRPPRVQTIHAVRLALAREPATS